MSFVKAIVYYDVDNFNLESEKIFHVCSSDGVMANGIFDYK